LGAMPWACGITDPPTTKGNGGMQCKPALKTAVHASFLLLMTLPRHPIGCLALEYNSYSSPCSHSLPHSLCSFALSRSLLFSLGREKTLTPTVLLCGAYETDLSHLSLSSLSP